VTAAEIACALPKSRKSGVGYVACCPAHEDANPSLSIRDGDDGRILVHCFASCPQDAVIAKLKALGVWPEHERREYPLEWGQLVRTYEYTDEHGNVLYQVCRFEPKGFKQRRPANGAGWRWGLGNVRRVPYRLRELIEAAIVFIAEGEKDVEALRDFGFSATCNSGGAGKWRAEFNQFFSGKEVCILPDADPPGWKHALDIARGIVGIAAKVQMFELPGAKDAAEWFAQGHSEFELIELVEAPCRH
jgi:putative DNA primase/helicase